MQGLLNLSYRIILETNVQGLRTDIHYESTERCPISEVGNCYLYLKKMATELSTMVFIVIPTKIQQAFGNKPVTYWWISGNVALNYANVN